MLIVRKNGALVEVNSETDFCAKNDEFKSFVETLTKASVENDIDDVEPYLIHQLMEKRLKNLGLN